MTRLQVLSSYEIKIFETPPEFNSFERKKYFSFSKWLQDTVKDLKTDVNKIGFLLQFGYFKTTSKFFVPRKFHFNDVKFICNFLDINSNNIKLEDYLKDSFTRHQELILQHFGFIPFNEVSKNQLLEEARSLTSKQLKPEHIFWSLIDFLDIRKIEKPPFNTISDIIIQALSEHESKLISILKNKLTENHKVLLDSLLEKNEIYQNEKKDSKIKRYKITSLKDFNHDLSESKIKENIDQLKYLQYIYDELKDVIQELNLSPSLIEYYAVWTKKLRFFKYIEKMIFTIMLNLKILQ